MVIIGSRCLVEKVLNAQPDITLAFETTSSMCFAHVRLFDRVTPRSLMCSFSTMVLPDGSVYKEFT